MKEFLKLNFNECEFISFESKYLLEALSFCDDIIINIYIRKMHLLADDCLQYNLFALREMLQEAIGELLVLHKSISEDIGILWNMELNGNSGMSYIEYEGQQFWVGEKYLLWSTPSKCNTNLSTWLYNDKNGNIIFEVTPTYHWHYSDPEPDDKDYIPYEQFIKSYKPLCVKIIPKDVASKLLEQIDEFLKGLEEKAT